MSALKNPLIADLTRCTGCRICELTCSFAKEKIHNPHLSRIRILRQDMLAVYLPVISVDCDQCGRCVELCPTGAIRFVKLDEAALLRKNMGMNQFVCPTIPGRQAMEVIHR